MNFVNEVPNSSIALAIGVCALLYLISRTLFWFVVGALTGSAIILQLHPFSSSFRHDKHPSVKDSEPLDKLECKDQPYEQMSVELRSALTDAIRLLIKNYVQWWYAPPAFEFDEEFPAICASKLADIASNVHASLSKKDCVFIFDIVFAKVVATIGASLSDIRLAQLEAIDPGDLSLYAEAHPESITAQLLDKAHRRTILEATASRFLKRYTDQEDSNCLPASIFLRKVLAFQVLAPSIVAIADKDAINQLIINHFSPTSGHGHALQETIANAAEQLGSTLELKPGLSEAVIDETKELDLPPMTPSSPKRGRRLSFKERLSGVESPEAVRSLLDDAESRHKRKTSLLARTSSFLSKSRSRSASPVKSPNSRPALGSRSNTQIDLYLAEMAVYDASEHDGAIDMSRKVRMDLPPQLTVMLSPTKAPGEESAAKGICIVKSVQELEMLDQHLRRIPGNVSLDGFPAWTEMSYGELEQASLRYLSSIVQTEALARSDAFVRFCRQDLDFEARMKALGASIEQVSPREELATLAETPTRPNSPSKPLSPFRRNSTFAFPPVERPRSQRSHSRAQSRSVSPAKVSAESLMLSGSRSWRDRSSELDVQGLVDQSMALLGSFFALSNKTWTIRRQLLNLLRGLLLSPNSSYAQTIVKQVEGIFDAWVDGHALAQHVRYLSEQLFSDAPPSLKIDKTESHARAEAAKVLLLRQGVPQAIKSLMGATPTNEATLVLFEVMQNQELMEGLLCMTLCDALKVVMNA
ncbi:PXA domain-domain-containing protein [Protomyces lactucae-debilis]|uniref:PXA domain-domain-containing protein n=1 Tax=Protomyces lactucae-debilis TaxID=2754530 RepID=A0A1Y2F083_PROLT|nr:PXA domain-containing protein [Protomyces lactucae-debilis]ORY77288.1 PXA domain-domain-containing protein [Protomyces lactucae-debilis]